MSAMKENLYTIVLEFSGGTYIRQLRESDANSEVATWAKGITPDEAATWGLDHGQLVTAIAQDKAVPVEDCEGVWCIGVNVSDRLALINVIHTA
jgi:hypothetical protein